MKGKKIRWRGYVAYVRNSDVSRTKIALAITPTLGDEARLALIYFGEDMRARLFALREKDPVEVTGTFNSDASHTPYIHVAPDHIACPSCSCAVNPGAGARHCRQDAQYAPQARAYLQALSLL
jgi:hypothetical protein